MRYDVVVTAPKPSPAFSEVAVDPRLLQANERTLLAWIRTAVGLMAFGFVIARLGLWLRLVENPTKKGVSVSVFVGAGVVCFASALSIAASVRFLSVRRALRSGSAPPSGPALEIALSVGVALVGLVLAAYLTIRV